ncbi:ComF family protein [bacterium]|nr:ComF family protein [bacterium]
MARRFKETSPWIAPLLAELLVEHLENEEFSAVEAVPMWPERRRERGYNPPALLAKEISRLKGWPFRGRLLRARPTPPQRGLSREERRANLKGAFVCAEGPELFGARILLLDDVMTTGSTLRASSNALLSKGVSSVVAGVVSRD